MNLLPIAQYLEDNQCGVQGQSIFIDKMQVTDTGVMLKSSYKGTAIDYELPGYYKSEFAVVVRGKGVAPTDALMTKVMAFLAIQKETQIGNLLVKYLRARTLPVSYPIPASGTNEAVVNVDCAYVLT